MKWVDSENLHLTLNFVGDLPSNQTARFCQSIEDRVKSFDPFYINITGLGGFPSMTSPKVIWAGVNEGVENLTAIHQEIQQELSGWRVNLDRKPFNAHVTLGRLIKQAGESQTLIEELNRLKHHDTGRCLVNQVVVYSSFLDKGGPTHTPMATIRLDR